MGIEHAAGEHAAFRCNSDFQLCHTESYTEATGYGVSGNNLGVKPACSYITYFILLE